MAKPQPREILTHSEHGYDDFAAVNVFIFVP